MNEFLSDWCRFHPFITLSWLDPLSSDWVTVVFFSHPLCCLFPSRFPAFNLEHPLSPFLPSPPYWNSDIDPNWLFHFSFPVASSTRCTPTVCFFRGAVAAGTSSWPLPSPTPWIPPASPCCSTSCTPPASPWQRASSPACSPLQPTCRWTTWPTPAGISCSCTGEGLQWASAFCGWMSTWLILLCGLACDSLGRFFAFSAGRIWVQGTHSWSWTPGCL